MNMTDDELRQIIRENDQFIKELTPRRIELRSELSEIEVKLCPVIRRNMDLKRELFEREKRITKLPYYNGKSRKKKIKKKADSFSELLSVFKGMSQKDKDKLLAKLG